MKFLKSIRILFLILVPTCLFGIKQDSWIVQNNLRNNILIESYTITDHQTFFDWQEQLCPTIAKAFSDEPIDLKNYFLDDKLCIKTEQQGMIDRLYKEEREELEWKIALSSCDENTRIESIKQRFLSQIQKTKNQLSTTPQILGDTFVVLAKNETLDLLGFAIFNVSQNKYSVNLALLAIDPKAQGTGLARYLIFSIVRLLPEIKNITLGTEIWNKRAQDVYTHLGFTKHEPNGLYISFDYTVK